MLVLVLILAYLICFCSCIGPVFWTLVPEIFPNNIRGTAMIVPVLTQWVANALVVLLFPAALHRLGKAVTFGILAAVRVPGNRSRPATGCALAHPPSGVRTLRESAATRW